MEYLKANGTEIPAQVCGKQIDRDWDGRASRTVTLTMAYAQGCAAVCGRTELGHCAARG